ncbi:MAG: hypothetical protein ACHQ1H_02955 [Nitrososphaerales archaeon]|jgi:hypothetical protein
MSRAAQKRIARKVRDAWSFGLDSQAQQTEWAHLLFTIDPTDFMLPRERKKFDELPDQFTVYCGFQGNYRESLSWTLNIEVAEMFSNLNEKLPKGIIIERRVRKSEIFALIDGDQQEIIILPRMLGRRRANLA